MKRWATDLAAISDKLGVFISTIDHMTMRKVKGVIHSDEPTENDQCFFFWPNQAAAFSEKL